ncbi:MAG: hypothetical protein ACREKE_05940 [bacterium]
MPKPLFGSVRAGLWAAVCLVALLWPSRIAAGPLWPLGQADARLIRAGWTYDARAQAWVPEAEIRLVNRDAQRSFHRSVRVEFVYGTGRVWVWKTFVDLDPGTAQHRRISAPARLGFKGPLADCPALGLRVDLSSKDYRDGIQPIPRVAIEDPDAPPSGLPLYVSAVEGAAVLRLLDGRRVEPLGVGIAPGLRAAADSWIRGRVMDAPIRLAYDAIPPDQAGRWRAYIRLPDGQDLGAALLKRGLARLDLSIPFAREANYRALAARLSKAS